MKPHRRRGPTAASLLILRTDRGEIRVTARNGRIVACELPDFQSLETAAAQTSNDWKSCKVRGGKIAELNSSSDKEILRDAEYFVKQFFAGKPVKPPPVELPAAAPFTTAVWRELAKIPAGETRTYGQLAAAAGRPLAARAAGSACGANQIPLFIPCHRVVGANGALGGFSSGLVWKKFLLRCEDARI